MPASVFESSRPLPASEEKKLPGVQKTLLKKRPLVEKKKKSLLDETAAAGLPPHPPFQARSHRELLRLVQKVSEVAHTTISLTHQTSDASVAFGRNEFVNAAWWQKMQGFAAVSETTGKIGFKHGNELFGKGIQWVTGKVGFPLGKDTADKGAKMFSLLSQFGGQIGAPFTKAHGDKLHALGGIDSGTTPQAFRHTAETSEASRRQTEEQVQRYLDTLHQTSQRV